MRQFEIREDHDYGTVGFHSTKVPHYLDPTTVRHDELLVDSCPSINIRKEAVLDVVAQLLEAAMADGQLEGRGQHVAQAMLAEIALR